MSANQPSPFAASTAHPDGRPARWPDGTPRSWGTGFTHCHDGIWHGYVVGSPIAASPERRKRGPRSELAFGAPNGTYVTEPPQHAAIPPRQGGKMRSTPV